MVYPRCDGNTVADTARICDWRRQRTEVLRRQLRRSVPVRLPEVQQRLRLALQDQVAHLLARGRGEHAHGMQTAAWDFFRGIPAQQRPFQSVQLAI